MVINPFQADALLAQVLPVGRVSEKKMGCHIMGQKDILVGWEVDVALASHRTMWTLVMETVVRGRGSIFGEGGKSVVVCVAECVYPPLGLAQPE